MSLAFCVTPASSFIYDCLYNGGGCHARTGFQKNFRFIYNNNFWRATGLRFVRRQKLRLLKSNQVHRFCKVRDGFNSGAASYCAASSFNDGLGHLKDCGRVEGIKKGAANGDGSDTSAGRGNHRGGGDNGGTGSGGLGESADWEGLRWFCWKIFKAWKYYNNLAKLSSFVVAGVGNIHDKIEGLKKTIEPDFDRFLQALEPLLLLLVGMVVLPCLVIAVAFCAALFAGVLLFICVVAALIWFWRSRRSRQPRRP